MSSAANGIMYKVSAENFSLTNAVQDVIEILAAAGVPILIHAWKLTITPTITSGVAQDVRARIQTLFRTTAGTGGASLNATGVKPANNRNTLAAAGTYTRTVVTTQGTAGNFTGAEQPSIIVPYERVFTQAQRILIPAGQRWCIFLAAALGAVYNASLEMDVEEV
jgi:hypothetical protein